MKPTAHHKRFLAAFNHLVPLRSAADKGDRDAIAALLTLAIYSTRLAEGLLDKQTDTVRDVGRKLARNGLAEEFPILWSWKKSDRERRIKLVSALRLGQSLNFTADGSRDRFYYRITDTFLPTLRFQPGFRTFPVNPDAQERRRWAKGIADLFYPRGSPREIDPVDLAVANPTGKLNRAKGEATFYSTFRTRFIDYVAARLKTIFAAKH